MRRDYQAEDDALDDEMRSLYVNPDDQASQQPSEESEQAEEKTPEPSMEGEGSQQKMVTEESRQEPVVTEKQYKDAVRAMNSSQQEVAKLSKALLKKDEEINQLKQKFQEFEAKLAKPDDKQVPSEIEIDDFKEAKEIYPEVINPLLKVIGDLKKKLATLDNDVGAVKRDVGAVTNEVGSVRQVADRYQHAEQQSAQDKWYSQIYQRHPDIDEVITTSEYSVWYNSQGPLIRQALQGGDVKDALAALDLYFLENPRPQPSPSQEQKSAPVKTDRLAEAKAASMPTVKTVARPDNKRTFTREQIGAMSPSEYAKYEDEIDAALSRGEIM